jgi:hypothetical protein
MTDDTKHNLLDQIIQNTTLVKNSSTNMAVLKPWLYSVRRITERIFGRDSEEFELIDNVLTSIPLPLSTIPGSLAHAAEEVNRN